MSNATRAWPVPAYVTAYWTYNAKPRVVWALRAGPNSEQPNGYPLGWSISRPEVRQWAARRGDGPHYIQRIEPNDIGATWTPAKHECEGNKA
jgi:hypothetical protein